MASKRKRSKAAQQGWETRRKRALARSKAAQKAAATRARNKAAKAAKVKPKPAKARPARPAPAPVAPARTFAMGPVPKRPEGVSPFVWGAARERLRRKLGREPSAREMLRETVVTERDRHIIEVWPDLTASAREQWGPQLSPAGHRALERRVVTGKSRAWRLLQERVGMRPVPGLRAAEMSEAQRRALDAWRRGKLDREYAQIALAAGLSGSEVYELAMSPKSLGRAA